MPFVRFGEVMEEFTCGNQRVSSMVFSVSSYILVLRLSIHGGAMLQRREESRALMGGVVEKEISFLSRTKLNIFRKRNGTAKCSGMK